MTWTPNPPSTCPPPIHRPRVQQCLRALFATLSNSTVHPGGPELSRAASGTCGQWIGVHVIIQWQIGRLRFTQLNTMNGYKTSVLGLPFLSPPQIRSGLSIRRMEDTWTVDIYICICICILICISILIYICICIRILICISIYIYIWIYIYIYTYIYYIYVYVYVCVYPCVLTCVLIIL